MVYPNRDEDAESVQEHRQQYSLSSVPALRDPSHQLVKLAGAQVTPQAAVFAANRQLVYRGRIDDRYVEFGRFRPKATKRDLHNVLDALADDKTLTLRTTKTVGCPIY